MAGSPVVRPIEIDIKHSARIKIADRTLTLANLVLVLQRDPVRSGSMGVTLSSSRPALEARTPPPATIIGRSAFISRSSAASSTYGRGRPSSR